MDTVRAYKKRRLKRLAVRFHESNNRSEKLRVAIAIRNLLKAEQVKTDGGKGSGNFNHEGRPGEIGGSAPSGSASSQATETYKASLSAEKKRLLSGDEAEQALAMWKKGFLSHDEAVDAMNDGSITGIVEEYYAVMEENGCTISEKPTTKDNTSTRNNDVDSGKYASHDEARAGFIKETTGLSDDECKAISEQAKTWVGNNWDKADSTELDKFIESDHTYDGKIYRGLHFEEGRDSMTYDDFMRNVQKGSVISAGQSGRNASWSSNEQDAVRFSHRSSGYEDSVIIKCVANRTASPIAYLNSMGEQEVISHSKAQWTVLNVEETQKNSGGRHAVITVVERGSYRTDLKGDGLMNKDDKEKAKDNKDSDFVPMLDRWEASSGDFIVEPPKGKKSEKPKKS